MNLNFLEFHTPLCTCIYECAILEIIQCTPMDDSYENPPVRIPTIATDTYIDRYIQRVLILSERKSFYRQIPISLSPKKANCAVLKKKKRFCLSFSRSDGGVLYFVGQANRQEKSRNIKIALGSFLSAVGLFFFQHSVIAPAQVRVPPRSPLTRTLHSRVRVWVHGYAWCVTQPAARWPLERLQSRLGPNT